MRRTLIHQHPACPSLYCPSCGFPNLAEWKTLLVRCPVRQIRFWLPVCSSCYREHTRNRAGDKLFSLGAAIVFAFFTLILFHAGLCAVAPEVFR